MEELKPYLEYRDSGVPWLGVVPEHWRIIPGRACFAVKHKPNTNLAEKTVLTLSYGRIIVKPEDKLHGLVPASFETYQIVEPGDIICRPTDLQNDKTSLRFGLSGNKGIITSAYICFRTSYGLDYHFGYLLLHTYDLNKIFYGLGSGLRQNLDWQDFKTLPCVLPSLTEQVAIVRFLDHMDRRIRRNILAKQKLIKLLEEYKQVIIHRAVTRGLDPSVPLKPSGVEWLGEVPEHWEVRKFRHLVLPVAGIQMGPFGSSLTQLQVFDTGFKLFGQENTISGDFHRGARWLTESQFIKLQRYEIRAGDLVLTRKGSIGKCRMVPHDAPVGIADSDTIRVRISDEKLSRRFAVMLLHYSAYLQFQIHSLQRGAVLGGLNTATIAELRIAVPPVSEQDIIVEEIECKTSGLDRSISNVKREISLLHEYRTRLISDVVTGKLDVRGIDLPAEEDADLLEGCNELSDIETIIEDQELQEDIPAEAD